VDMSYLRSKGLVSEMMGFNREGDREKRTEGGQKEGGGELHKDKKWIRGCCRDRRKAWRMEGNFRD